MKSYKRYARWICIFCAVLFCCLGPLTVVSAHDGAAARLYRAPYLFCVEDVTDGQGFSANSTLHIYDNYVFPASGTMTVSGWFATDEGIDRYEYAWVSGLDRTPEWKTAGNISIFERPDLAVAGIPYVGGHGTAGFSFDIYPPEGTSDGYYDLYVRAVTGDGVGCDMALFSHMMYGTPDYDDGEVRLISFDRLKKTAGALTEASITDMGLEMTNRSMVAWGSLELGVFDRIRISYTVSEGYTDGKQALLGFKSAPDHLYGDGKGLYDLTNHLTALPIKTDSTEPQTAELDLAKADLKEHGSLYLCTYLKDGVTLTVHEIELTYRGQGYDRTAAKIYFSSDVIGKFSGTNMVTLHGVNDSVMGDVLRIEVIDETNDPFAHFNANRLMFEHDIRLSADDYKYMVVLARASSENQSDSMTFYLCAGNIYGATEACTYSHHIIPDGKWHYYVFDLTARENWKGGINGWRFDIINGNCQPGNYVDYASVQFFRTKEAAETAASASVTNGIIPHASGMPAVVRDDVEESLISDEPMTFKEGDWFEETTVPETEPLIPPEETLSSDPADTLPSDESETAVDTADTQTQTSGCGSVVSISSLALLVPLIFAIKKKKRRIQT